MSDGSDLVPYPPGFGNVGINRVAREAGQPVVKRTLDHEKFKVFKLEGSYFPWRKARDQTWEAVCPGNEPPSRSAGWGTLYDLVCRVRERRPLKQGDKDLELLRSVLVELLRAVQLVHQQAPDDGPGWLGLLDPTNVVYFVGSDGRPKVFLPDAGFRWTGWLDAPRHLTELRWAGKPAECKMFEKLWDSDLLAEDKATLSENERILGNDEGILTKAARLATKASETEALARMLGWVVSGKIFTTAPKGTSAPEVKAWLSLEPFLSIARGRSYTAADLAELYKQGPAWAVFAEKGARLAKKKSGLLKIILLCLALFSLLSGVVIFQEKIRGWIVTWLPTPDFKNQVCPECGKADPYYSLLEEISGKDGAYNSLDACLTKGVVGDSVSSAWILSKESQLTEKQAKEVKTEQVEKILAWIKAELVTVKKMQALDIEETDAQVKCRERLVKQLQQAIENTARVMALTNSTSKTLLYPEGELRTVIKEFKGLATDLKLEDSWPPYVY